MSETNTKLVYAFLQKDHRESFSDIKSYYDQAIESVKKIAGGIGDVVEIDMPVDDFELIIISSKDGRYYGDELIRISECGCYLDEEEFVAEEIGVIFHEGDGVIEIVDNVKFRENYLESDFWA